MCIIKKLQLKEGADMSIGHKIKSARIAKGYTQEELGQMLGVQKSAIAKYESGRVVNIKRSTLKKISEILDIKPSELISEEKEISTVTENDLKVALFGSLDEVTDEMWEEVKNFAEFVKNKNKKLGVKTWKS